MPIFETDPTPAAIEQRCKAVFLPLLRAHAITRIEIEYDGEGDEGSVCDVRAYRGSAPCDLPEIDSALFTLHYGGRVEEAIVPLYQALSDFAANAVCARFSGWENGNGAYGTIVIDVEAETVTLEHNERLMDYDQTCVDL